MALYDPVNGVYRKVSKKYDPVDGVYRKVKAAYDPVDGVYRQYFSSGKTISAGYYSANDDFDAYGLATPQELVFRSNETRYYAMGMDSDGFYFRYYPIEGRYDDGGDIVFNPDYRADEFGEVYGWQDEEYSGIEITSDQVVSEEFYNWFTANWYKLR